MARNLVPQIVDEKALEKLPETKGSRKSSQEKSFRKFCLLLMSVLIIGWGEPNIASTTCELVTNSRPLCVLNLTNLFHYVMHLFSFWCKRRETYKSSMNPWYHKLLFKRRKSRFAQSVRAFLSCSPKTSCNLPSSRPQRSRTPMAAAIFLRRWALSFSVFRM